MPGRPILRVVFDGDFFMTEIVSFTFVSGAAGGLVFWLVNLLFAPRHSVLEHRVRLLEETLRKHIAQDRSAEIVMKLDEMEKRIDVRLSKVEGQLEVLSAKVDRVAETSAGHSEAIRSNRTYIDNLRDDLQDHIRSHREERA